MSDKNFGLSASLIAAARQIVEKKNDDDNGEAKKMEGGKTAVNVNPETDDKIDENEPKKKHTTPKTPKDKKLAALAHPKDKITHKDVLVGRGVVKKEETEVAEKTLYGTPDEHKRKLDRLAKKEKALPPGISPARKALAIQKQKLQASMKKEDVDIDSLTEEQLEEVNHREFGAKGKMHPDMAKGMKVGRNVDFYARGSGDKTYGQVTKNDGKSVHVDVKGKTHKFSVTQHLGEEVEKIEELSDKTLGGYAVKVAKLPPEKVKPSREAGIEKATKKLRGMKEELSPKEIERIEELAKSFPAEVDEAVKKSVPSATTVVSTPIRGANQDQSGVGTKSSVADYTISDGAKFSNRHGDLTTKKVKEEVELEEGRGRPRKNPLPPGKEAEGDDTHKHPMQQLEKISHSIEGNEPHFEHKDGSKSKITKHLAKHIVAIHNSMRTTQEKDSFAQKVHANRDSLRSEVSKHF